MELYRARVVAGGGIRINKLESPVMKRPLYRISAVTTALLVIASGCVIDQYVVIDSDGSGETALTITVDPAVVRYVDSLIGAISGSVAGPLFDVDAIREGIDAREGLEALSVETTSRATLAIVVRIDDIESALAGVASITRPRDGDTKLDIELDRTNFSTLTRLFIDDDSPAAAFVPVIESDFLTPSEYRELSSYVLEDYLIDRSVDAILEASGAALTVSPRGVLQSAVGGTISEDEARFWIPALEAVTLVEPLRLSLEWRE